MGRWAARIAVYLGISHLIGTIVCRASTRDQRKSGTWIDLPTILARRRHAPSVKICTPSFGAGNTGYTFGFEEYGTEVGDQICARKQGFVLERPAYWRLFVHRISDVRCIKASAAVQAAS
jgi:hypothetical protein